MIRNESNIRCKIPMTIDWHMTLGSRPSVPVAHELPLVLLGSQELDGKGMGWWGWWHVACPQDPTPRSRPTASVEGDGD